MDKLTAAQLAYWKRWAEKRPTQYDLTPAILSLIAEVHEGRRVVEIDGATTQYAATLAACSRCHHPLYVVDRQKFCDECGVRLTWKE